MYQYQPGRFGDTPAAVVVDDVRASAQRVAIKRTPRANNDIYICGLLKNLMIGAGG